MTTLSQLQVASLLSIPPAQVLQLARNGAFPQPTSVGGILMWDNTAVTTFVSTFWTPTFAHGWKPIGPALATFNFTVAAAAPPGPGLRDLVNNPLFDV
jgi:hypothetical protein